MRVLFLSTFLLVFPLPGFPQAPAKRRLPGPVFSMPGTFSIEDPARALPREDPGLARLGEVLVRKGCSPAEKATFHVKLLLFKEASSLDAESARLGCPERLPRLEEAFFVHLAGEGAEVGSLGRRGLFYGLLALAAWIDGSSPKGIRGGWILDWPSLRHRAYMLDMGRLVERKDYYRKVLRFLAFHRFNTFVLHLSDDPTTALRFKSHPEPADPHAWTPEEMGAFVKLAGKWHVSLLPEVELFGHVGAWVRRPEYRALAEPGLLTLSPHRPGTYRLIRDLAREAAGIFPGSLFHAGLDEVAGPSSKEGKAFVRKWGKGAWLAAHVIRVHDILGESSKRMVMWGDMLLRYPDAAGRIPRDTLIYDWHYGTSFLSPGAKRNPRLPPESWVRFRELGFEVAAAPALMNGSHRLWPDQDRLTNTLGSARLAARYGLRGVCVTQWLPQRYLPDSIWLALALSGDACWAGTGFHRERAEKAFFRDFFGLEMGEDDLGALHFLLRRSPLMEDLLRLLWFDRKGADRYLAKGGSRIRRCLKEAEAALGRLQGLSGKVTRHRPEFQEILRVARVIRHLAWREAHGRALLLSASAGALRQECRKRTKAVLEEIRASWAPWRYLDNRNHHDPYAARDDLMACFEKALEALKALPRR